MSAINVPDHQYRWWLLLAVIIGAFMSILDSSIVNIALPKMMAVFSVDTSKIQWVSTAYALAMGVVQPTTAYLGNVWGQKKLYVSSLVVFTIGSLLCGIAWSNDSMIFFRVIQAIGGGMIMPVSLSLVYAVFPPEERGVAIGIWGIAAMIAPSIGPTLGGYIVEHLDWRMIFTINIPIGILGTLFSWLVLKETATRKASFDLGGFLSIGVSLFCLILALSRGQDEGWGSTYIVSLFIASAITMLIFIAIELYHSDPLLDIRLFKDIAFTASNLFNAGITIVLFGSVFLLPIFMENLQGYTAMETGLIMLPQSVASGLAMPISGKLTDKGYGKIIIILGIALLTIGTIGLIYLDLNTSMSWIKLLLVLRGIGLGLCMMPATNLGLSRVPMHKIGSASSINNVVRQVASAFGIALLSSMLDRRQIFHSTRIVENLSDKADQVQALFYKLQAAFIAKGSSLSLAQEQVFSIVGAHLKKQATIFAFDDCFTIIVVFSILSFVPAFFLPAKVEKHGEGTMTAD